MTATDSPTIQPTPTPPPRKRHHWVRNILAGLGGLVVLIIVIALFAGGGSKQHATTAPAAAPSTSAPSSAPAAPAAAPAAPAVPQTLLNFTGHGNGSTPSFTTSGDFTVTWTYSGNVDTSLGSSTPSNFILNMSTTGQGPDSSFNGANDIQASGTGNQTVSGDDGTHYVTVQSNVNSTWTVKVTTAS